MMAVTQYQLIFLNLPCSNSLGHYEGMLEQERRGRDPAPPTPTCLVGCGFIMDSLAKLHCARFPGES